MPTHTEQDPAELALAYHRAVPAGCAIDTMAITPTWVRSGTARAEMAVDNRHVNQVGVVQGGVYGLFADATAGWAAMSALPEGKAFVTLEMRTNLLRAARPGQTLVAEATPVHLGGTTCVFEVRVHPEDQSPERLSAFFVCTQLVMDAS